MAKGDAAHQRHSLRVAIMRAARSCPSLSAAAIAQRVGCHPRTVRRHLRTAATRSAIFAAESEAGRQAAMDRGDLAGEVLARGAASTDPDERLAAARHPACPPRLLLRLAIDPNQKVRAAVLITPQAQRVLRPRITAASFDGWAPVRGSLAALAHCPARVLHRLATDPNTSVATRAASNPNCPPRALRAALAAAAGSDTEPETSVSSPSQIGLAVARNPNCPPELQQQFAGSTDPQLRAAVAQNRSCSRELMTTLAQDPSPFVRSGLAANPHCPPETVAQLAKDSYAVVSAMALANPACPPKWLAAALRMGRHSTAVNVRCPPAALEIAAQSKDNELRRLVALNPSTPQETLDVLARSDEYVALAAAANPSTPQETLAVLARHGTVAVREAAAANLSTPPAALEHLAGGSRREAVAVAANRSTPGGVLAQLAHRGTPSVRAAVAANPNCPHGVRYRLAGDKMAVVRVGLLADQARQK